MRKIYFLLLIIIFLIAIFLRFFNLEKVPAGFHVDEASLGYNAYSLLLTGKDENNHPLPLYIDMFGDNRPSGYHYLTILPVKFFGLNVFATRFMAAFFGSISVFAIFFLSYTLFNNKIIALFASLLLAIAPWHVVLSRASAEAIVALFFIFVGFAVVFQGFRKKKALYISIGGLILSLSFFFYHTPRVFVPLLFFIYFLYYLWEFRSHISLRHLIIMFLTFVILSFIALSLVFVAKGGTGRFTQVNIFGFPETKLVMQEQIREDGTAGISIFNTRFYHNKLLNFSLTFVSNYFSYFDGNFLFIKGGLPIWYKVPNMGLIYLIELPFFLYGIFQLLVSKSSFSKLPIIWLSLAPIVAAFTVDDVPNINRAIVLFPIIEIVTAYGIISFITKFTGWKTIIFSVCIASLLFVNFLYFQHQYIVHASTHQTWYRNNGFDKLISRLKISYNDVDEIVITKSTGGIYPLILFYMHYDPRAYQLAGSPKDKEYTQFGKFFFAPQDCPSINKDQRFPKNKNIIFVDRGDCPENKGLGVKKRETILREDGTKAFRIVYE